MAGLEQDQAIRKVCVLSVHLNEFHKFEIACVTTETHNLCCKSIYYICIWVKDESHFGAFKLNLQWF